MIFNSLKFFIFFPLTTTLYFLFPRQYRWLILLIASCIFYAALSMEYLVLLASLAVLSYFCAILIEQYAAWKKPVFLTGVILTCSILFIFKYYNFFNENIAYIAHIIHWNYSIKILKVIIPLGISFYTLQIISYLIEVYIGRQKAERHLGIYSLFVIFYPKLLAGPIEKPYALIPQLHECHEFEYHRVADGLKLMAWGYFEKIVIADRLASCVNPVFNGPSRYQGISFIVATVFFAFQIYCDFAGYSDIARGAAQVMGFNLVNNFNRPYFAKSIYEFWRRWHISLSTWLRDYIYTPVVVYKRDWGNLAIVLALMVTFVICGLWHGASWTFIVWGALNGVYITLGFSTKSMRQKFSKTVGLNRAPVLRKNAQVVITFLLTCFAWIFFRANSIKDAFYIITHLFANVFTFIKYALSNITQIGKGKSVLEPLILSQSPFNFLIAIACMAILISVHLIQRRGSIRRMLSEKPLLFRWAVYYLSVIALALFGIYGEENRFIYFNF